MSKKSSWPDLVTVGIRIVGLVVNIAWRVADWEHLVSNLSKVPPALLLEEHLHEYNEHHVVVCSTKKGASNGIVGIHGGLRRDQVLGDCTCQRQ